VPKGLEPEELDMAEPAGHDAGESGLIPLDELDPDATGAGNPRTKDEGGDELDLLEIESEHEQPRRG
jgi:hypothetical protein